MRKWLIGIGLVTAAALALAWPVGGGPVTASCCTGAPKVRAMDLQEFSSDAPSEPTDLLFLHHSIGGQMLADPGKEDSQGRTHPNGGGLRKLLIDNHYRVHEATYGSKLGEHTDLFDWLPKFRDHMPEVLRIDQQDRPLAEGQVNRVVLWKSCYPNNYFMGEGKAPGSASGPDLTLANAQATFRALLPVFAKHPDTLFVYLTTPPPVRHAWHEPGIKWLAKKALGKPTNAEKVETFGRLSRAFASWVVSDEGWLKGYAPRNVVAFDYYDVLTDHGESSFLRYPTAGGVDNHPNSEGNRKAAAKLVPFLNRALRRAFPTDVAAAALGE